MTPGRGALAEGEEAARRRALLTAPHMRPLGAYVRALNAQGRGWTPDFDPCDGGVRARLLLLLEKPGPGLHSGFVSRDNDTPTGRTIRRFMLEAGLPRDGMAIWNLVPWWNGTMTVRRAESRAGAAALPGLLALLPDLHCVVLAGRLARNFGAPALADRDVAIFECVHPSPNARAGPASSAAWRELPRVWRQAWQAAQAAPLRSMASPTDQERQPVAPQR